MERRRFIQSTIGLGLFALPGVEILNKDVPFNLQDSVSRGNIRRGKPPGTDPWVLLYQGNGRFGSCMGPWGLHMQPDKRAAYPVHGATRFTHIKHYIRGKFNADYLIPIGSIYWETEPQTVTAFEQTQSFYEGTITTKFTTADHAVTITSWFDAVQKDVAGFQLEVSGNCPAIILNMPRHLAVMYDQQVDVAVKDQLNKDEWQAGISCLNAASTIKVSSNAGMQSVNEGLKLQMKPGVNTIMIAVNGELPDSAEKSLQQTKTAWQNTWKNSGWLDLPDTDAQKVWVRSLAYALYSHNDDGMGGSPPTGLAGNGWPFDFPFDSGCRHLLLLMTGQTATARKWVEFWYARFDGLKEYTKRLFKSEGIFMPHVFPYGTANDYHYPAPPNKYYYPVYNSALMVRIADHTAIMVNDATWTSTYAKPLIQEAAKFYLSHLKKGEDGLWHLHIIPSISLDESGDVNKPDYVSGLISAQYTLQKAIEYGLDTDQRMQTVLHDGLAFKPLLAANGMYLNHFGVDAGNFSKQKHPDQLFAINHTPLGEHLNAPHQKAHELRYETTDGAKIPRFLGHTLGEFILSSSRMHDADGWRKDWSMMLPAKYTDPGLVQFYESTGNTLAFYVTTHGLFAQALLETTVSTWWNRLDLCTCIPWKGEVRFTNIRTLLGVTITGSIKDGTGEATLQAWKDTSFQYLGDTITLKKGRKMVVKINSVVSSV